MSTIKPLRLLAEDEADLQIISAAVQDAVTQIGALNYQARKHRFSLELNRFQWEISAKGAKDQRRVRSVLAFDSVLSVRSRGIDRKQGAMTISLLAVEFDPGAAAPAGTVRLVLAGDGEIALDVECLDVTLLDSSTVWPTKNLPDHEQRG